MYVKITEENIHYLSGVVPVHKNTWGTYNECWFMVGGPGINGMDIVFGDYYVRRETSERRSTKIWKLFNLR
jgi:hypothetical protein